MLACFSVLFWFLVFVGDGVMLYFYHLSLNLLWFRCSLSVKGSHIRIRTEWASAKAWNLEGVGLSGLLDHGIPLKGYMPACGERVVKG